MTTMQKLLTPATADAIVARGSTTLGGPVTRAVDVVDLSPADLVAGHGWLGAGLPFEGEPDHVDVLRFDTNPLMRLDVPGPAGARPWPTFELGFLTRGTAPVWLLGRTRVPIGTEYWRIDADGGQRQFSFYAGPGVGWSGSRGYRPPVGLTGPRARWRGLELPAALTEDGQGVELVMIGDDAVPEGFETTRPGVHRRIVPISECESVFELDLDATWRGAPVRVLQIAGEQAQLLMLGPDEEGVDRLEAVAVEPGTWEAVAPRGELVDVVGVTRELSTDGAALAGAAPEPTRSTEKAAPAVVEALLGALDKLPVSAGVTYRGWSRTNTFGREGPAHVTRLLTATSRDVRVATENFTSDGLYAVIGRAGRDIAALSAHPAEQEVVFRPSTIFKVLTVARIRQLPFVLVEELDPSRTDEIVGQDIEELATPIVTAVQAAWLAEPVEITTPGKFVGDVE